MVIPLTILVSMFRKVLRKRSFQIFIFFLVILFLGVVGFYVLEGKDWFESLYWAVVTVATIGYGDIIPTTQAGKILAMVMAFFGIGLFATIVTFMANHFLNLSIRKVFGLEKCHWKNHVIICGWNEGVESTVEELLMIQNIKIAIIKPPTAGPIEERENLTVISDDPTREEALKKAGIDKASHVIISTGEDSKTILTVLTIKKLRPNIKVVAEALSSKHAPLIKQAGAEYIVNSLSFSGRLLASSIHKPGVVAMFEEISTSGIGNDIMEISIPKQFIGKNFKEALVELKEKYNCLLIGLRRNSQTIVNPASDEVLRQKDSLLVICTREESEKITST